MTGAELALTLIAAGSTEARLLRQPDIHGDQVVFTYAGDLWLSDGGQPIARRLTSHRGVESRAKFSPDGQWIAFTGQYGSNSDVYVIPAEGGEPKRLTYGNAPELVLDWTPDGRIAYGSPEDTASSRFLRMWTIDPKKGVPEATDIHEVGDIAFSPDGRTVAMNRNRSHAYNWRHYRGGTQGRIGFFDLDRKTWRELPSGREQSYFPMWSGGSVYYISDRAQNSLNLYRADASGGRSEQLTRFTDGDIRWPSSDGKKIVYERNGQVQVYDIASRELAQFTPRVLSDNPALLPQFKSYGPDLADFSLSPSGKRLAVEARGEIFSLPAESGQTRNLTATTGAREKAPMWSPDGQHIAYLSDASGDWKIIEKPQMGGEEKAHALPAGHVVQAMRYSPKGGHISYTTTDLRLVVLDRATGEAKEIARDAVGPPNYDWSPDERWIAYTATQPSLFASIRIRDMRSGEDREAVNAFFSNLLVSFDLAGGYLYFTSARSYTFSPSYFENASLEQPPIERVYALLLKADQTNPLDNAEDEEPVKKAGDGEKKEEKPGEDASAIDFENLQNRVVALPWGPGQYGLLQGVRNGVLTLTGGALQKFDWATKQPSTILSGAFSFSFNADKSKLAYFAGDTLGVVPIAPNQRVGAGAVSRQGMVGRWDPRQEFGQMFWEVWRHQRDNFYDPGMVGLDWKAVGDKYAAMLPYVGDRSDLDYLFGLLIGELGTGHAYVTPAPVSNLEPMPQAGLLGADLRAENGRIRFARVYPGVPEAGGPVGPLGAPGVKVSAGDYLLAVNGQEVDDSTNVAELLVGTIGQPVKILVNSAPIRAGAREATVRPAANDSQLRYFHWVEDCRARVDRLSGGRIGYMHIPDTSIGGILGFNRGFYSQSGKEAWVIDERFNGGGWIPTFFIEKLVREMDTALRPRNGMDVGFPTQSLEGPKVMLINEHAGSGGDMLPWLFKNRGLGPLIGTRTWGGLVGITGGVSLVDGGSVTSPSFGIYDTRRGAWIAENTGVDPDIEVDNDPSVWARGEDAQIERAVRHLMEQLAQGKGRKSFSAPAFPKVGKSDN